MPNFIHHTAKWDSRPAPVVANGAPLSVRTARGNPNSRNARSNHGRTPASLGATIRQQNTNRANASAIVSGSHRTPSPVRNQPLKSAVQTSLGAWAAAKYEMETQGPIGGGGRP